MHSMIQKKRRGTPRLPIGKQLIRPNTASRSRTETPSGPPPVNGAVPPSDSVAAICPAGSSAKQNGAKQIQTPAPSQPSDALAQEGQPPVPDLRNEKMLTVKEAAFRSMKSEDTIYKWLRTGRLRGWQLGGHGCNVFVAASSLEEALKSSTQFGK